MKDAFGRELKVGDWITYPRRRGSCMWPRIAQIEQILEEEYTNGMGEKLTRGKLVVGSSEMVYFAGKLDTFKKATIRVLDNVVKTDPPSPDLV